MQSVTFTLKIASSNDAFCPTPGPEIARILRHVAEHVEVGEDVVTCMDLNGNAVGWAELDWRPEE